MASLPLPKSPSVSLIVPLLSSSTPSTLSPSNVNVTMTSTLALTLSPTINTTHGAVTPTSAELLATPPPQLPPRLLKNGTNNSFVEATAPPRPPKPTPRTPQSDSLLLQSKSDSGLLNLFVADQNDERITPEKNFLQQGAEPESEETVNICLAPPLPPKPAKQSSRSSVTVSETSSF